MNEVKFDRGVLLWILSVFISKYEFATRNHNMLRKMTRRYYIVIIGSLTSHFVTFVCY